MTKLNTLRIRKGNEEIFIDSGIYTDNNGNKFNAYRVYNELYYIDNNMVKDSDGKVANGIIELLFSKEMVAVMGDDGILRTSKGKVRLTSNGWEVA